MTSRPLDTSAESWTEYQSILDGMGAAGRLAAALELSDAVRAIRLAGIRSRDPELSHREAVERLVAEEYGVEAPFRR
jgi:hypothetical protein